MQSCAGAHDQTDALAGFEHEPRFVEITILVLHDRVQQRLGRDRGAGATEPDEQAAEQPRIRHRQLAAAVGDFARGGGATATWLGVHTTVAALAVAMHEDDGAQRSTIGTGRNALSTLVHDIVTTSSSSISLCRRFWIAISVPDVELGQLPQAPW